MTFKIVNRICYTIAIICIVVGVIYGLMLIWGDDWRRDAWRGLASLSIVFLASVLTLSVNQVYLRNRRD